MFGVYFFSYETTRDVYTRRGWSRVCRVCVYYVCQYIRMDLVDQLNEMGDADFEDLVEPADYASRV